MKVAGQAMKNIHKEAGGVEKVDIMADIEESNAIAGEISEAISRPMGGMLTDDFDDDDLMGELEELEQEELDSNLVGMQQTPQMNLPVVPQNNLPAVQQPSKEDQDLDDLNNWILS